MNTLLQAVLDDLKREEENERSACCSGGRLPECPRPEVPCTGSESQREDEGNREQPKATDQINPLHYRKGGVECIQAIDEAIKDLSGREAHYTGCALKYLWRQKCGKGSQLENLKKARWYIDRLVGYLEGRIVDAKKD